MMKKKRPWTNEIRLRDAKEGKRAKAGAFPLIVCCLIVCAVIGFSGSFSTFAQQASQSAIDNAKPSPDVLRKIKIASDEHELILLFIENKNYDKVEPELKKIFDLKLDGRYESAIAKSLLTISYKLLEARQLDLAQKILDSGMANVSFSKKSYSDILKFKAYLLKEAGDLDSAIEVYKRAKELDEKP